MMADFVDIRETYMVAGDYDSRKRYIRARTGGSNPLAVCSGVTWAIGPARPTGSEEGPYRTWKWELAGRLALSFQKGTRIAPDPAPQRVTDCMI